jgi:hypothetical protein
MHAQYNNSSTISPLFVFKIVCLWKKKCVEYKMCFIYFYNLCSQPLCCNAHLAQALQHMIQSCQVLETVLIQ